MAAPSKSSDRKQGRRRRGFETAGALLARDLQGPAEKRGFADAKLLTHWAEIMGPDLAEIALPVKITHGRGFGGTLVVLTTGGHAPVLEMQKEAMIDKVNACYGYRAVSHVHITQTAPTGFAEGQVAFRPKAPARKAPDPARVAETLRAADGIEDSALREALARLARNVLSTRQD
jgi:hypothetical protein